MKTTRRNFLAASIGLITLPKLLGKEGKTADVVLPIHPQHSSQLDLSLLLHCIAQVETGGDDTKVGRGGERSKYQISEAVWVQHTGSLFTSRNRIRLCRGLLAEEVAMRHLRWLVSSLPRTTPFWLAYAWNQGCEKTNQTLRDNSLLSLFGLGYATRVEDLYVDTLSQRLP